MGSRLETRVRMKQSKVRQRRPDWTASDLVSAVSIVASGLVSNRKGMSGAAVPVQCVPAWPCKCRNDGCAFVACREGAWCSRHGRPEEIRCLPEVLPWELCITTKHRAWLNQALPYDLSAFISAAQTRPWQLLWPACPGCKHAFCNAAQVADTIVTKEIS